jgi:hypothetical protein
MRVQCAVDANKDVGVDVRQRASKRRRGGVRREAGGGEARSERNLR